MLATRVTPLVKWAGGKQAVAGRLVAHFPVSFERYYEPFVGGGSVLFALRPTRAVIGDRNDWLLDIYQAIRTSADQVLRILDGLQNTKTEYLRIRAIPPADLPLFYRAAHLLYLNKTCFRGLFRVNRHGRFNVPYGQYDRRYYDPDNVRAVAAALQTVEIRRGGFECCVADVTARDFVYMDPPYHKIGGYSDFNRYTKDQFRESDHLRLASLCRGLDERGVRWAVSNSDTPLVREAFRGYRFVPIANRREINLNSQDRAVTELLIINYAG